MRQGEQDAILKKNLQAVELFNHKRHLGRDPTLEKVIFAVVEGGCDRSTVYDTLATAPR